MNKSNITEQLISHEHGYLTGHARNATDIPPPARRLTLQLPATGKSRGEADQTVRVRRSVRSWAKRAGSFSSPPSARTAVP
ncbi:hypothetical protein DFR71_1871 [Nocardia alba]|uniref:Uncharacterized protein n=1 Tax=Nocardia alba TaxID=225051 RepID=A0A4R1FZY7_9NOCA|nr:hypothetical protein DFR71_1871 [Nocardia alba]